MTDACVDLVRFADGELEPERAEAFRAHLLGCNACRDGLLEALQLGTRLAGLPALAAQPEPAAQRARAADAARAVPAGLAPVRPPGWRNPNRLRRHGGWSGAATAAMALAMLVLRAPEPEAPADPFAQLTERPYEIRLAYSDAGRYRPTRNQLRGGGGPDPAVIPYAALDALQRRRDGYALAIARAWNGVDPARVAEQLRGLAPTPSVRGDLAAIEILIKGHEDVESVLAELEGLRGSAAPGVAHAARWNYALLLSRLGLELSAAQAFRAIASEREPGWAGEAALRAQAAERAGQDSRDRWQRAFAVGAGLIAADAPAPIEVVRSVPGMMRAYFYNAVRTAASRERALALAPIAAELDRVGGAPILSAYVQRVARLELRRRAPLADAYARLLQDAPITASEHVALLAPAPSADVADIVMGAMVQLDVVAEQAAAFRRLADQTSDPWFEVVLAKAEATADVQRGDWLGAEARLRAAEKLCGDPAVAYQCLDLHRQLGALYEHLHRVPEALAVVQPALATARSAGEWAEARGLLWQLADIELLNSSTASARVYANEVLLLAPESCDIQRSAYATLTGAALLEVDGRAGRRYLTAALGCGTPDLAAANYLTDIGRLDPRPGDLAQLQGWLNELRAAAGGLTAAERVFADEIEGRLLIERDRAAGSALLERAIAAADALPRDVIAEKARAGAYSVLAFDAAHAADYAGVLGLLARELGLPSPGACTVGLIAEDERSVVVVRGADGPVRGGYATASGPRRAAPVVSAELARELDGCAHVQVLAQGWLQGQPRVLPAGVAWSYVTGARRPSPATPVAGARRTLIVTNVSPPAELALPPLSPQPADLRPWVDTLGGPAATPAQVLTAMRDAGEIQFHTHALVNLGVSDASYLVLSPDAKGRYALTAEAIRSAELRGQPLIVLAACQSAQGAHYQHAPWSLPHAFLAIGARGVFAAGTAIPDREAGPVFARVLERVHHGADPAVALRDERLAADPGSWVADVMLFE
jgi:hypothetical protein